MLRTFCMVMKAPRLLNSASVREYIVQELTHNYYNCEGFNAANFAHRRPATSASLPVPEGTVGAR